MTPEDVRIILVNQNGLCPVCLLPIDLSVKGGKHVDHDRRCCEGKKSCGNCIRGVLHPRCNTELGFIEKWMRLGLVTPTKTLENYMNGRAKF